MQDKKRILVIEDDVDFRNLLRLHLSLAGYTLEVAEDGVEGGKALLERPPDLVLSDVNMPFLGGFELLSLLHADENTAAIPVILLSGRSDDDAMSKAMSLGAADYLTKPITLEELMRSIQACLANAEHKPASATRSASIN
jgi:DNA-binding response OmpR family regulator